MEDSGGIPVSTTDKIVVAIDGPAGSGKSSVSKAAARRLGFSYQDTGAAYRALAWYVAERGIDTADEAAVVEALRDFDYAIGIDPDNYFVRVGGIDVEEAIREPRISAIVSSVARILPVRAYLVELFRHVIETSDTPGIITEGRDITTVVCPDAPVRILLTASEEARMARRSAEISGQSAADVAKNLLSRDAQDSRVVDFMNAADGVTVIDSTDLDFDQTIQAVVDLIDAQAGESAS
ncbi:(d)CMP kinase [Salinibacterium hongtaonis]|uniref:(d)CMP kinase n=1 Tax=Homoserinimonas hongtaonis TaxID=2079791 RepID=UPI000D3BD87A|nr:(d)CMP kinase [Salinibacterium hongtaonis]AWB88953.1 (d)CMP kinase [Salinibacterium hongtaonis]